MKYSVCLLVTLVLNSCAKYDQLSQSPAESQYIEIPYPDFQGHRGARGLLPENTVPSFIKALELGVTTLELDLVVSKDSVLVVSHEPWFNPEISSYPDGSPVLPEEARLLNLFRMDYPEIKSFDVGNRGNPRFPNQLPLKSYKPTLVEVVETVENWLDSNNRNRVWYNIETKSVPEEYDIYYPQPHAFANLLVSQIHNLRIANRTIIQSFDPNTLIAVRSLDPSIQLALLIENQESLTHNLERLGFTPEIYSPYYQFVDSSLVTDVHKAGMRLIPWTVNDAVEMKRLLELGVNGMISDYPNLFDKQR